MSSITRKRWPALLAGVVLAAGLAACSSSGPSVAAGSAGHWTQAQESTFAGLGYFGSGPAFTNCVRAGMEKGMSYTDATNAFNAIPTGATSKAQIVDAISSAVGSPDGPAVAASFYAIATSCNKQSGASAQATAPAAPPTTAPAADGSPGNWTEVQKSTFESQASSGNAAMDACQAAAAESKFSYLDMMAVLNANPPGGFTDSSQLTSAMEQLFGITKGDQVAQTLISQATACQTQTGTSASPTAAPSVTTSPVATPSSAGALTPWTVSQRNQLTAAYNNDRNLSSLSLECLQVTISQQVPARYALKYVAAIWVIPAPPYASVLPVLESKYGGAEGKAIYTAWQAVTVAVDRC